MKFSKFFIASLKRTAQNVQPLVRRKNKILQSMKELQEELESIETQLQGYQTPIMAATGGLTTEDLVVRTITDTGKKDKEGNPIKVTKYELKYPETIVPLAENENATAEELNTEVKKNDEISQTTEESPFELPFGVTVTPSNN